MRLLPASHQVLSMFAHGVRSRFTGSLDAKRSYGDRPPDFRDEDLRDI